MSKEGGWASATPATPEPDRKTAGWKRAASFETIPIAPAKLATKAVTGYPTALRWLTIHHPEFVGFQARQGLRAPVAVAPCRFL